MSDEITMPASDETPAATGPAESAVGGVQQASEDRAPKWDGELDKERVERLVNNLRNEIASYKAKLREYEDAGKSELQKAQEAAAEAAKDALNLRRQVAALKAGLPEDLLEFVTGETDEEIAACVEKLAKFAAPKQETPDVDLSSKPKAKLIPGHGSDVADDQLTEEDLKNMSSAEIVKAYKDGRFKRMMGIL